MDRLAEQAPEASTPMKERLPLSAHVVALGGYLALTLILTFPIATKLSSEIPAGGDAWHNIWNLWWVKQAIFERHTDLYHTDMLYYPGGTNLYFHTLTLTAGLMSLPLQLLGVDLLATYSLILLAGFVLAGYGTFLLCYYLTGSRWASFVGGFAFAFSPYHFAHLFGHMNLASLQWIPFYTLALLKAMDRPGPPRKSKPPNPDSTNSLLNEGEVKAPNTSARTLPGSSLLWAAAAGALLALNAYTDWLYAIFLVMLTALLLAWRLLVPSERRLFGQANVGLAEGALRLLVGTGVFFLLVSPVLVPSLAEAQKGYAQQSPEETLVYSSDAMLAFTPSELHPIWGKAVTERVAHIGPYMPQKGPSERVVFLGYSVIGLALYAAWRLRARREVRLWLFAAVATWVLSLGPILQVLGKSRLPFIGATFPLPYALLYQLPLFNIARTPSRLAVLTMLSMSILAAFALAALLSGTHRPRRRRASGKLHWRHGAVAFGLPLLILFEFLAIPFPTVPPGWNVPIYSRIAAEPGRFALLELPLQPVGDYMAYQTIHGKPIIGGFLARQPPYPIVEQTLVLKYLLDTTSPSGPEATLVSNGEGVRALQELGVKYVIIHWWLLGPDQKKAMEAKFTTLLARPPDFEYPANEVAVWQLSP
ncbi:MAG TPA: hypothetical protein VEW94_10950 [Chloroflexia bacterium]|nr:hypothetical protein [Chloroflexia bacterium]